MSGRIESVYKDAFDGIKSIYDYKLKRVETRRHQFNIILVMAGILSIAIFTLYTYDITKPWIFAGLPLILLYFLSLCYVFPKPLLRPWYSFNDFKKVAKGDIPLEEIYKELDITMYLLVHKKLDRFDEQTRRDIIISIYLIVSIFSTLVSTLILNSHLDIFISFVLIIVLFGFFFFYLYNRFEKNLKKEVKELNEMIKKYMNEEKTNEK